MEKKAARLRVISSVLMAIVLGVIASNIGGFIFFSAITDPDKMSFVSPFLLACFALGPVMMWVTHRFFHQTKVIYIILLTLGVPVLIIGILVGIGSWDTIQSIQSADIPGERQEHAALGSVMMLMFAAIGILLAVIGLLMSVSATLGLWAFKIRSRIPPDLAAASQNILRQSHRSKVWPTPR